VNATAPVIVSSIDTDCADREDGNNHRNRTAEREDHHRMRSGHPRRSATTSKRMAIRMNMTADLAAGCPSYAADMVASTARAPWYARRQTVLGLDERRRGRGRDGLRCGPNET